MNFIKYIIKDFFSTCIVLVLIAGLWFFYLFFIPEHSVKLILISIVTIIYIDVKFFSKKSRKNKAIMKSIMKTLIITEVLVLITIALWFFYVSFIPEHWMKLMLLSIVIIIFINIKYGLKKPG